MESPPHERRCKRSACPKSRQSEAVQLKSNRDKKIKRDSEDRRCNRKAGAWQCSDTAVFGKPMCQHHLTQIKNYLEKKKTTTDGGGHSDSGEEDRDSDACGRKINADGSDDKKKRRRRRSSSESDPEYRSKNRIEKGKVKGRGGSKSLAKSADSGNVMKNSKLKEGKSTDSIEKVRN